MTGVRGGAHGAVLVVATAVATVALMERIAAAGPLGLAAAVLLLLGVVGAAGRIGRAGA